MLRAQAKTLRDRFPLPLWERPVLSAVEGARERGI